MARILVVEDDPRLPRMLARVLERAGYEVEVASSGEQAVGRAGSVRPDVALIDVNLPGLTGLETFTALRESQPNLVGIFMTAFGSIRSAVDAMRAGGFDYITKPFDNDELLLTLERALEMRRLGEEVRQLREEIGSRVAFPGIVGRSPRMLEVLRLLPRVAASAETVLILGASGTGKELIARSLHRASARESGPFVAVNCSAIPVTLFETEFFGHERGAFTDAHAQRIGRSGGAARRAPARGHRRAHCRRDEQGPGRRSGRWALPPGSLLAGQRRRGRAATAAGAPRRSPAADPALRRSAERRDGPPDYGAHG